MPTFGHEIQVLTLECTSSVYHQIINCVHMHLFLFCFHDIAIATPDHNINVDQPPIYMHGIQMSKWDFKCDVIFDQTKWLIHHIIE